MTKQEYKDQIGEQLDKAQNEELYHNERKSDISK